MFCLQSYSQFPPSSTAFCWYLCYTKTLTWAMVGKRKDQDKAMTRGRLWQRPERKAQMKSSGGSKESRFPPWSMPFLLLPSVSLYTAWYLLKASSLLVPMEVNSIYALSLLLRSILGGRTDSLPHPPSHMAKGCKHWKTHTALNWKKLADSGWWCWMTAEMIAITGRLTEPKPSRHEGWCTHDVSLWLSEQQEIHESDLET